MYAQFGLIYNEINLNKNENKFFCRYLWLNCFRITLHSYKISSHQLIKLYININNLY